MGFPYYPSFVQWTRPPVFIINSVSVLLPALCDWIKHAAAICLVSWRQCQSLPLVFLHVVDPSKANSRRVLCCACTKPWMHAVPARLPTAVNGCCTCVAAAVAALAMLLAPQAAAGFDVCQRCIAAGFGRQPNSNQHLSIPGMFLSDWS